MARIVTRAVIAAFPVASGTRGIMGCRRARQEVFDLVSE